MSNKAWGGRFEAQPEEWVDDFNASITFDQTLIDQDIEGSIAHATMLRIKALLVTRQRTNYTRTKNLFNMIIIKIKFNLVHH